MPVPPPLDPARFLRPVSVDDPAGPSLRWESEYTDIEEACREEEDAKSRGEWGGREPKKADWATVVEIGETALREKSKDLQIAAWVAEGWARRKGLAGLRDGLALMREIQDAFWATAHPASGDLEDREGVYEYLDNEKRLPLLVKSAPITDQKGLKRYSFLKLKETRETENTIRKTPARLDELLAEGKIRQSDFDAAAADTPLAFYEDLTALLDQCLDEVVKLNASIRRDDHYGPKGLTFGKTFQAIEDVAKEARALYARRKAAENGGTDGDQPQDVEEEPVPDDVEAVGDGVTTEDEPPPAPVRPAPRPPSKGAAGPITGADDALARIVDAARYLRETADPADPTPYLVVRALRMGGLYAASQPLDPNALGRPDGGDREGLRRLAKDGAWADLLSGAERALSSPSSVGWLDARRYAHRALVELGRDAAARAVLAVLGAELRDFPEWPETELRDATPSASGETRAWLASTFEPPAAAAAAPEPSYDVPAPHPPPPEADRATGPDAWAEATDLARRGLKAEAFACVSDAVRDARTGRDRFLRTLQQAELCLLLQRTAVASALLEGLARQVEERSLSDWEDPGVCARVVGALYQCLRAQGDPRAVAVYGRLCQLDAAAAFRLDPPGHP